MEKVLNDKITESDFDIILTMETCVKGGSVSLFRGKKLLDFYVGDKSVSGSEDLLPKIAGLLSGNNIKKSEISLVAVSNGPGSFTGIRIGIATALALKKSLNCKCYGFDLLKVLAQKGSFETNANRIITAVSHGRNKICWFNFEMQNSDSTSSENRYFVGNFDSLVKHIAGKSEYKQNNEIIAVFADADIYKTLAEKKESEFNDKITLFNAGDNLSEILGFAVLNERTVFEFPKPLYLSEANFIS